MSKLDLQADPREIIAQLWPEHAKHLSPPGNRMGGGKIDPEEGVVCNCGEVLGYPKVQDEADYVLAEPEQPDTSGAQTGEPDDEPELGVAAGERSDPPMGPETAQRAREYGRPDTHPGGSWRCRYDGKRASEHPIDYPGQFHCITPTPYPNPDAPGPLARSVQGKADTIDALWNHPDTQAAVAAGMRDAEMRERFEANPYDVEARAYVHGPGTAPEDEAQNGPYAVGDTVTVGGIEFTKRSESPFPEHNPTGYVEGDESHHTYVNPDGSVESHNGAAVSCRCYVRGRSPWANRMIAEQPGATQRAADADQGQVEGRPRPAWAHAEMPEQALPCELNPVPHLLSEHPGQCHDYTEPTQPKGVMPYRDPGVVEAQDPLAARVVVIDPSQPYGPRDVEEQLLDIEARLERGMHYQRYWEEREFAAESAYTAKAAKARWESRNDGAKDIRDAAVQIACQEEWQELLLCRAMVRSMRETMHTLRSLQSGYQTVSRSVTESMRQPARRT